MERELVTLDTIASLEPIDGADKIELATVRGWKTVVRKGEFQVGDSVIYFEIDSALPLDDSRFSFLGARGTKIIDGRNYHVLKTVRLRGQISQGLVLPAEQFEQDGRPEIFKWEKPVPMAAGNLKGNFPLEWAPKTDAERIQNLGRVIDQINELDWVATEKIDGTSTTYINDGGTLRIASRNYELDVTPDLMQWKLTKRTPFNVMHLLPEGFAVQGEIYGAGIQGNPLGIKGTTFSAFNLYNQGALVPYAEWPEDLVPFRVPVLDWTLPDTVEGIVAQADGMMSTINSKRRAEGVVWHCGSPQDFLGGRDGFKAISNTYLAKEKE